MIRDLYDYLEATGKVFGLRFEKHHKQFLQKLDISNEASPYDPIEWVSTRNEVWINENLFNNEFKRTGFLLII